MSHLGQPHLLSLADLSNRRNRIDGCCRSRANRGDDGEWHTSETAIVLDLGSERLRIHSQRGISPNLSERLQPKTQSHHRFVHARVRLLRAVNNDPRQIRTSGHSLLAKAKLGVHLACGRQRVERVRRCSVGDHPEEILRQAEHLPQPIHCQQLELRRRWTRSPEHCVDVQCSR